MRARRQNGARSNNDENAVAGLSKAGHTHQLPSSKFSSASTNALRSQRSAPIKVLKETAGKIQSVASAASGPRRALGDISQSQQSKANTYALENDKLNGQPTNGKGGLSVRPLASKGHNRTGSAAQPSKTQKPGSHIRSASTNSYKPQDGGVEHHQRAASAIALRLNDQSLETGSSSSPKQGDLESEDDAALHTAPEEIDTQDASMADARTHSSDDPMVQESAYSPQASDELASSLSESSLMLDPDNWLAMDPADEAESQRLLAEIRAEFEDEVDMWDTTMVAEYADEIFDYMGQLECSTMPNPTYMDHQDELSWDTRTTLLEWLLQIHLRYHMLPETLWIATNIIDRFLSTRQVSLVKLQLVGITAIFLAAKYEEIMAPSVEEFVALTDNGYSRDEILKGERIILQTLEFNISPYCSPYSWVRRISKADDYDIQTRTLCKFLMEIALLDPRFLRAKPSMIAAAGMYLSRKMLGGEWDDAFMFYSGFTEMQLAQPAMMLTEQLLSQGFSDTFLAKKYSTKKHLKASIFAVAWAQQKAASEYV